MCLTRLIQFTDDVEYWQNNYFYYPFQKSITFMVWSGKNIKIYGKGTMDGNGQAWYNGFAGREILVRHSTVTNHDPTTDFRLGC